MSFIDPYSGAIAASRQAGIPESLLLPLRPFDWPTPKGKPGGKDPAYFEGSCWRSLDAWEKGNVPRDVLDTADRLGGNCGLLLGSPIELPGAGMVQFAAVDIDLTDAEDPEENTAGLTTAGQIEARNTLLAGLLPDFGPQAMVRETRPYRALILPAYAGFDPGRKHVYTVHQHGKHLGKIELLATGQQALIAGRHPSSGPIYWHRADAPGERTEAPPVGSGLSVLPDFSAVTDALSLAFGRLKDQGFAFELAHEAKASGQDVPDYELAPATLTASELASVVRSLLNAQDVGYDTYALVMIAVDGAAKGIAAHHGPLSETDESNLATAVAEWILRWDNRKCPTLEAARAQWERDFHALHKPRRMGWAKLCALWHQLTRDTPAHDFFDGTREQDRDAHDTMTRASAIIERHRGELPWHSEPAEQEAASFDSLFESDECAFDDPKDFPGFIDLADWDGKEIPERRWIVKDWLPVGHTTLIYGDGGIGKSLLIQELLTSCALGKPWLGIPVEGQMPVLGIFCEDAMEELLRRQNAINERMDTAFAELAGKLHLVSWYAETTEFIHFSSSGEPKTTKLFGMTRTLAKKLGARVVALDVVSDFFDGDENTKRQPRVFIRHLIKLAKEIDGAVLLSAHPSKAGMASGRNDSGSTSWNGTVRSRWALTHTDKEKDPDGRILSREKSNYAPPGDKIRLRWQRGLLLAEQDTDFPVSNRPPVEDVFLALLDKCAEQGVRVSNKSRAGNYAPKEFARRHDENCYYDKKEFEQAMVNLFSRSAIRVGEYTHLRTKHECIMRV